MGQVVAAWLKLSVETELGMETHKRFSDFHQYKERYVLLSI